MTSHRTPITLAAVSFACALLAFSGRARAQLRAADVECRKTETQAECFKRLKCKADEELEACQKRLLKCNAGENLDDCKKRVGNGAGANQNQGNQGGNRADERTGREQENRERDNGDRGDRGDQDRAEREREEREREQRENDRGDRGNRDEDSGRDRSRRGGGGDGGSRGRRRRGGGGGGGGFEANKTFGLGLELGEPSGLNGKVFVSHNAAIDFGVGYIYDHYYYRDGHGFHAYADLLFHPLVLAHADAFELPLYVGPGIRFWDFRYCDTAPNPRVCYDGGSAIGIRVPIGIDFDFNNVPLDIFLQFVPVLDFLSGGYYTTYDHREHFGVDFSAGVRFWFK